MPQPYSPPGPGTDPPGIIERFPAEPGTFPAFRTLCCGGGGLVTARRSSFDGRDSYYHLDLERCGHALADACTALHPAPGFRPTCSPPPSTRPPARSAVLFAATGNSARSPIAEALLRHRTKGQVEVTSAGSHPKPSIAAVRALREHHGIDISSRHPQHLDTLTGRRFDYVITLCDKVREVCTDFGDHPRLVHWSVPDPAAAGGHDLTGYPAFVRTAAEIDTRIRYLLPLLTRTPQEVKP